MKTKKLTNKGFTIVELLVAMTISLVVIAAITYTFKSQQDSYIIQTQVSSMQQNLRAAMYMLTRDIQMAGYYTNFDPDTYTMNWDDLDGDDETIRSLIHAIDNRNDGGGGDGIKDGTDLVVIIKAAESRQLAAGETASGNTVPASLRNVDNLVSGKCAMLVKHDLSTADFFQVQDDSGDMTLTISLDNTYSQDDWIFRVDVIVYYVDDDPNHPCLLRKNLGTNETAQVVAENIDNLQLQYLLNNGSLVNDPHNPPTTSGSDVRAVKVFLLARTANTIRNYTDPNTYNMGNNPIPNPNDGYRRKLLTSIIKTRNIGL
jgi:prepilin-type N-terminal cleavage/methylation domain-containing protein